MAERDQLAAPRDGQAHDPPLAAVVRERHRALDLVVLDQLARDLRLGPRGPLRTLRALRSLPALRSLRALRALWALSTLERRLLDESGGHGTGVAVRVHQRRERAVHGLAGKRRAVGQIRGLGDGLATARLVGLGQRVTGQAVGIATRTDVPGTGGAATGIRRRLARLGAERRCDEGP